MKLELKHLAPYLPYGLKGEYVDIKGCIVEMAIHTSNFSNTRDINCFLNGIKPILKPVLDFDGMIIRNIKLFLEISHNQTMEFLGFMDGQIKLQNISLGLHEAMCKKHIDFNNLIPQGLAIDINTLNK